MGGKYFSHLRQGIQLQRFLSQRKPLSNHLLKHLSSKIKLLGPITVHEFMREALTNVDHGYYMTKTVFGKSGDFITSPEISQLFGEMIAIWTLNEWEKLGRPKPLQIVELGPGRATMMQDILRVYNRLGVGSSEISLHLVEVSEKMRLLQGDQLCGSSDSHSQSASGCSSLRSGITPLGVPVYWHDSLRGIPNNFSCILAHEFFDALPVHILKKTERGWRELLVDVDDSGERLRFVISANPTPACVYSKYSNGRDYFEFSPESGVMMEAVARRLEAYGGFALIVDYGHEGDKADTFRGFRGHQVVDPLVEPGSADLTADVDLAFLKSVASDKLISFGPVTQRHFLSQLHIDVRLQMVLKNCPSETSKAEIKSGFDMIMSPEKMGDCFKVLAFFPAVLKDYLEKYPVVGFQNFSHQVQKAV